MRGLDNERAALAEALLRLEEDERELEARVMGQQDDCRAMGERIAGKRSRAREILQDVHERQAANEERQNRLAEIRRRVEALSQRAEDLRQERAEKRELADAASKMMNQTYDRLVRMDYRLRHRGEAEDGT